MRRSAEQTGRDWQGGTGGIAVVPHVGLLWTALPSTYQPA
ncbi:MAG: hypothetical protein AVDCRST_MAG93-7698 [uncultured Chloroflexia bacterium]|uniref:Uncharacterized protein n=1 Tax=uncultured Chloroflexia bacterium TaxID=1672391 RepID=A0A6J4MKE4_9CHLR|nr:MAG: hypothetical protein AVDCRST_MAG93-7698 [uncultured Chloroflexia bacterium]